MEIVVIGATGKQGRGTLGYLLDQKDVTKILLGARGFDKVRELAANAADRRVMASRIDLSDTKAAVEAFRGADVVINCAYEGYHTDESYLNLELMATKAALEAGVNYVGVGGAPPAPEQLAFDQDFKKKGILAILGMGELTGLVQVMAAYGITRLNRTDRVEMKYGERDLVSAERHRRPLAWGPRPGDKGKTDMAYVGLGSTRFRYCANSLFWQDGKLHSCPPRANPEVFDFSEPIGSITIAQTPGAATVSLSRSFPGIKHISLKSGGDPDFENKITFLRDLGLFSQKPVDVQGQKVVPWEVLMTLLAEIPPETVPADIRREARVIVKGIEEGRPAEYILGWSRLNPSKTQKPMAPLSGLCAAVAAVMLGRGQTRGKGVAMPEICIPPDLFLDQLSRAGLEIEIIRKVKV